MDSVDFAEEKEARVQRKLTKQMMIQEIRMKINKLMIEANLTCNKQMGITAVAEEVAEDVASEVTGLDT